ncbi:MAG TPA: hypothetical protein VGB77_13945 [Abditibacteriaceae bacterium]
MLAFISGLSRLQLSAIGAVNSSNTMFTVTLSEASSTQVSVSYATANSTAIAGSDYTATNVVLAV